MVYPETLDNDVFTGKLINQPFYVEEMEEGGVYSLNTEMLTDWNIYFSGEKYTRIPFISCSARHRFTENRLSRKKR